tara:strand:- start:8463 stop:9923 length:1461 start_codon:yes stop_codon:yes gene_type:complete
MNKLSLIKPFIKTKIFDECVISSITDDSRDVIRNSLFIARQGEDSHGIEFAKQAIENGASCIISDKNLAEEPDVPFYFFERLEEKITDILYGFYELNEDNFIFHGITGTNGKTTTAFMAHNIIRELQRPSIYIGTLGAIINDSFIKTKGNTTPGIFEIFKILKSCDSKKEVYVFLEISSHALSQKRLSNLYFNQTIILNIHSDHLDYHKTYENYIDSKLSITKLNSKNPTIISIDHMHHLKESLLPDQKKQIKASKHLSSKNPSALLKYSFEYNPEGFSKINLDFPNLILEIKVSLFLKFNVDNYISALALISDTISSNDINCINKSSIKLPKGRGELLRSKEGKILIDFAHDHKSFKNILSELHKTYDEIILVFGCGGDRDKSKRTKMMKVAQEFASKIIFTSDNNRFESFYSIFTDALNGNNLSGVEIIEDRQDALKSALKYLNKKNILVILGKGHETFMEVQGKKIPFNDKDCVLKILSNEIN